MWGIYHVLSRGVDKRQIFMDDKDRYRFIHDLFEFNDQNPSNTASHHFYKQYGDLRSRHIGRQTERKPRKLLVDILAFCLMPNHYHLLIAPKVEDGMVRFMRKMNIGYAKYFNEKYERSGALFEGRYKSVLVANQAHFIHLPYYIHLNPLDMAAPEWRERKINNFNKALDFLNKYKWSSHLDYLGKNNFPSVTQREFLLEVFDGQKGYEKSLKSWLRDSGLGKIKDLILE